MSVRDRWMKLKHKCEPCPDCKSNNIRLGRHMFCIRSWSKYGRYWIECGDCYWCGKDAFTIRGAIRKWNKYDRVDKCIE